MPQIQDLRVEARFEGNLAAEDAQWEDRFGGPHHTKWGAPLKSCLEDMQSAFKRGTTLAVRPTPPELLARLNLRDAKGSPTRRASMGSRIAESCC